MPDTPSERKLAAVLVADVVGYSRLTAEDEEGTINRLRRLRAEIVDPAIALMKSRLRIASPRLEYDQDNQITELLSEI